MIGFLGEYEVTIDPKGRFLLPAKFKEQLPEDGNSVFVINRGVEKCLSLYPIQNWQPLFEKISKMNDFKTKVRKFKRAFLNGATKVEVDSAGRLLIPQSLRDYAGLGKDVVLMSMGKRIEIWDISKYKTEFFESYSQEEFEKDSEEVMSDYTED